MPNRILLYVVCLCTLVVVFTSGPNEYFTEQDHKHIIESILFSSYSKNGSFNKNLKDTYFAIDSLLKLSIQVPDKVPVCKYAKDEMEDNIESIFYSVSIREALGCGETVPKNVESTITSALGGDTLYELVYGVGAVSVLKPQKHINIDSMELLPVVSSLTDLMDSEYGTWFLEKKQEEGSPYLAGLALSALAKLVPYLEGTNELSSVIDAIPALLENGDNNDASRFFFRHTDNTISSLKTTAFLIKGLADLAEATKEKIGVQDEQVALIANYLITQKFVSTIEDANALLIGLNAVNSPSFKRPLVLSLINSQIHTTKEKNRESDLKILVTDVWGKQTVSNRVFLVRAYHSGKEDIDLLTNQEVPLVDGQKNTYSLDFLAARPDPGAYVLEFRVLPQEKTNNYQSISSALRRVQVVAGVSLSDGSLAISDQAERDAYANTYPFKQDQTISQQLQLKSYQYLHITFKLRNTASNRAVVAHQTFVKITNQNNTESAYFVVPHSSQTYDLHLGVSKLGQKFNSQSGSYTIELLIGDSFISSSFRWIVAKVNISFDGKVQPKPEKVDPFTPRPVINHHFRPSATLAPEYITSFFTILVIIPFVLFLVAILRVGGNFSNFPSGVSFLSGVLFVGGVGLILALIVVYWLKLKLFGALGYGLFVSIPTIFFGNQILRYYAQLRDKKKKD